MAFDSRYYCIPVAEMLCGIELDFISSSLLFGFMDFEWENNKQQFRFFTIFSSMSITQKQHLSHTSGDNSLDYIIIYLFNSYHSFLNRSLFSGLVQTIINILEYIF